MSEQPMMVEDPVTAAAGLSEFETLCGPNKATQIVVMQRGAEWAVRVQALLPDATFDESFEPFPQRLDAIVEGCEWLVNWCSEQKGQGGKKHRQMAEKAQDWALDLAKITALTAMGTQDEIPAAVVEEICGTLQPAAGETPAGGEIQMIPVSDLYESPLNPRQYYPETAMQELVASMRQSGFRAWLPLLVRPIGAESEIWRPVGASGYEIGAGHRRCRAAREAAGWRGWMERTGKGVLDIAARIGRSKEYVYQRLKYSALIPEAQRAFLNGEFKPDHAIRIARCQPEDQKKAVEFLKPSPYHEQIPTTRELDRWIHQNFCLSLEGAPFDRTNVTLLAGAETCEACPKRGANIPGYTPELGDLDVCTDLQCYRAKKASHLSRAEANLLAKIEYQFVKISVGYQRAGKGVYTAGDYEETTQEHADREGVKLALFVDGPKAGQTTYVRLKAESAPAASGASGGSSTGSSGLTPQARAEEERKAAERREKEVEGDAREYAARLALVGAVADKVTALDRVATEYLVQSEIDNLGRQEYDWLSVRHGLQDPRRAGGTNDPLIAGMYKMADEEFARLVVEVSLIEQTEVVQLPQRLEFAAKRFGVDSAAVRKLAEAKHTIETCGIDFDADRIECQAFGGKETLAYVKFKRAAGGFEVFRGGALPMVKGNPFGEFGPLYGNNKVWSDRGEAIDAALIWIAKYADRAMKHSGVNEGTRAAAAVLRGWIKKGQAARAAMTMLLEGRTKSAAKKPAPAKSKPVVKKKTVDLAVRKRIADQQKKRWAEHRRQTAAKHTAPAKGGKK